jgi:hypothetical protein
LPAQAEDAGDADAARIPAIKMAAEWSDAAELAWMEHWITPGVITEMSVG